MDNGEILETLKAAKLYLSHLKLLDTGIETAVRQVINTFEESEKSIHRTFSNLKDTLISILNKREHYLLEQARKSKKDGLLPLEQCRSIILDKIETTDKLINIGNSVINGSTEKWDKFNKDSSFLGSLPEVPELKEVPFISFCYEPTLEIEVVDILTNFGDVCRIAPIQITELIEKPGAILVEWQSVENEERMTDIQEFRLQRAFGDVVKEKHLIVNFNDCYRGLDTQFLVKDLQENQPYSFRVCCKFEGTLEWSPWSLPQVLCTTLKPFSWKANDDYLLSNENKIVRSIKASPGILYSDGPQFCVGHSVEFTFLEIDSGEALIGLVDQNIQKGSVSDLRSVGENSFLINQNGSIFIDGSQRSTKLSDFTKGLKVCFTCDLVKGKVRVNIDANEKRVTYGWIINPESKMYFALQVLSANWKVMVE